MQTMIPVGYTAKFVSKTLEWLNAEGIDDIYSISGCISKNFADYIKYWKHNGWWFFDSPQIIQQLALDQNIDLNGTSLFYYEVYPLEVDDEYMIWNELRPTPDFTTNVIVPNEKVFEGYDVATVSGSCGPECSPLSCNGVWESVETNRHCLLDSLEQAIKLIEDGVFDETEPGALQIYAVYSVLDCASFRFLASAVSPKRTTV